MAKKPGTKSTIAEYRPMVSDKPLVFDLKNVIDVILMMERHERTAKFSRYVKSKDLKVELPRETVNAVKEFVAKDPELSKDRIGVKVRNPKKAEVEAEVESVARGPYRCF